MVAQNNAGKQAQPKQERTCHLCGHTGTDVGPCEFPTLDGKHLSYRDICDDMEACDGRIEARRQAIAKEVEEHIRQMRQEARHED